MYMKQSLGLAIATICLAGTALGQQEAPTTAPGGASGSTPQQPTGTSAPQPAAAPLTGAAEVTPQSAGAMGTSGGTNTLGTATPPTALPPPALPAVEAAPTGTVINPEAPLETGPTPVKGKWNPVLYGFVEFDSLHDSTQSFNDVAGNASIQNPNVYTGKHGRTQFGGRNSRLGFKLSAPEMDGLKISGILEMDFLGNQPGTPPSPAVSENSYFTSPAFRMRHYAMKLENPYVDVLVGQYWQLFGWQTYFHPATVEIQGMPGQLFARSPQIRLSHTFKTDAVNLEVAVAAARPPQRNADQPDAQAGLRLLLNQWKGVHTMGGAGTASDAAGIGISGVSRRFSVPEYTAVPAGNRTAKGWGLSMDVLLPVIPGTMEDRGNSLSLTGSFVTGQGISDLYTGLSNGATASWPLPNPTGVATPAYVPDLDSGLIEFDNGGNAHAIKWQTFIGGIQYYLPPKGHLWVALNYSHMQSSNILNYVSPAARGGIFNKSEWYDANLFWDATVATRFGVEYAHFKQTYADNSTRGNDRVQASGWLLF